MKLVRDIFRSYAVLNAESVHVNGTDRESNHHYGDAYEALFTTELWKEVKITEQRAEILPERSSTRTNVKLMMEVGVATGESLWAWSEVFPNATIVGMDTQPSFLARNPRIEFHIGDATKREDCDNVVIGRQFDLIVDDASHQPADVLIALFWLWPHVRRGGMYVIEDFPHYIVQRFPLLWSEAEVVYTTGPFGGMEPLVVFRRPL